jgi:hypothetical protein
LEKPAGSAQNIDPVLFGVKWFLSFPFQRNVREGLGNGRKNRRTIPCRILLLAGGDQAVFPQACA